MSYILTPPHPQGYVMSVKFEKHLHDLTLVTVHVCYCKTIETLNITLFM